MYNAYDEIYTQDEALKKTYAYITEKKDEILSFLKENDYKELVYVACGSSYWMSLSASRTMQKLTGIPCIAVKSGDVIFDKEYYEKAYEKPLFIVPSRSGRTSETLLAVDFLKEIYKAPVFCMVEYEECGITDKADFLLKMPWANEISVCQTRSFSCLYMASVMMAAFMAEDEELLTQLKDYIDNFQSIRPEAEKLTRQIAGDMPDGHSIISLATGVQYGVAIEGAYISVEMAQYQGSYYGLLEFRHGPIVMVDDRDLIAILSAGTNQELEEDMAKEIRGTGAKVLSITADAEFCNADYKINLGKNVRQEVTALFGIFVLQAYAYERACSLDRNPDKPKELVPFIQI